MKAIEIFIERLILASRFVLVVFYVGLGFALAVYAVSILKKLWKVTSSVFEASDAEMILSMLALIDAALVASLLVMVMIASYENFVGRFDDDDADISFLGKLDSGSLKIKVASSIVAISSIHLLQVFLNADQYAGDRIMWLTVLHMAFVVSALLLGFLEKLMAKPKP